MLEPAILGLLHGSPMHGYELRKRLNLVLGSFRALSYGSLYPALRTLVERGWIEGTDSTVGPPVSTKRARIVYQLTAAGKDHLQEVLSSAGPSSWEDEQFDVRFAFFGQIDAETRLRILEGRRSRLTERLELVRQSFARTRERMDSYTLELQRHGLDTVEREVRWLDGLIDTERSNGSGARRDLPGGGLPATAGPHATTQDRPTGDPAADAGRPNQKERG